MEVRFPVMIQRKPTPEEVAAAQQILAQVTSAAEIGIANPKTAFGRWLQGKKSYIVMGLTIAMAALGMYTQTVTVEVGIGTILAALGYGANRSASNTQTAQLAATIVNPASPAAKQAAAAAPIDPPTENRLTPEEAKMLANLLAKKGS